MQPRAPWNASAASKPHIGCAVAVSATQFHIERKKFATKTMKITVSPPPPPPPPLLELGWCPTSDIRTGLEGFRIVEKGRQTRERERSPELPARIEVRPGRVCPRAPREKENVGRGNTNTHAVAAAGIAALGKALVRSEWTASPVFPTTLWYRRPRDRFKNPPLQKKLNLTHLYITMGVSTVDTATRSSQNPNLGDTHGCFTSKPLSVTVGAVAQAQLGNNAASSVTVRCPTPWSTNVGGRACSRWAWPAMAW